MYNGQRMLINKQVGKPNESAKVIMKLTLAPLGFLSKGLLLSFPICFLAFFIVPSSWAQFDRPTIIEKLVLAHSGMDMTLKVNIHTEARCNFGDADALLLDLLSSGRETKILLTLEPVMPDKNFKTLVQDVTAPPDIHTTGYTTEFTLPSGGKPMLLGLFVCKDSDKQGSCSGKKFQPINEVISNYEVGVKHSDDYRATDKIYYFKFLVFDGANIYYPARGMTVESYEELDKMLAVQGMDSSSRKDAIKRVQELNQTLGSVALGLRDGNTLEVVLPRYVPSKCK
jgi:hypothetical protein